MQGADLIPRLAPPSMEARGLDLAPGPLIVPLRAVESGRTGRLLCSPFPLGGKGPEDRGRRSPLKFSANLPKTEADLAGIPATGGPVAAPMLPRSGADPSMYRP